MNLLNQTNNSKRNSARLLYILYINDLPTVILSNISLDADDTSVMCVRNTLIIVSSRLLLH